MQTLFVMCGLSFSGKTTLARRISEATGSVIVSYDKLFAEVDRAPAVIGLDEWYLIIGLVHEETRRHLVAGRSVIVDNLNEDLTDRDHLRAIADEEGARTIVVYVEAPLHVIAERRRQNDLTLERGTTSDENFHFVLSRFQPPAEPERYVRYTAGEDINRWLGNLLSEGLDAGSPQWGSSEKGEDLATARGGGLPGSWPSQNHPSAT